MQSSLGIYIEDHIIKYAKLQKDKDVIKVEAYNLTFYDEDLATTLNKIISETYSYRVPITINVSNEMYNQFKIPSLLSKADGKKAVALEFETMCNEKGYNRTALEHRYVFADEKEDPEKRKVLSVIANKSEISKRMAAFGNSRVSNVMPLPTSITNLIDINGRENIAIVNIEMNTQITIIIDGQIYQINILDEGMGKILEEINQTENFLPKSYEVCKNMTIYTQETAELYSERSEYMDIITSSLYNIVMEMKNIISGIFSNIDKIYITGLGTCVNNVDLYFQEYIQSAKCEILKPYFVNSSSMQIPIKDYIEVNSAIALALDGLGMADKDLNFGKKGGSGGGVGDILKMDINFGTIRELFGRLGPAMKSDFAVPLESKEKLMIRGMIACVMIMVVFCAFSLVITKQIDSKKAEIAEVTADTEQQLAKIDDDIKTIEARTRTYQTLVGEITESEEEVEDIDNVRVVPKDAVPNLLNRIMFVIPKKVKLTSIKNTTDKHIVIKAEAEKYEQLGYFKAVLSTNNILTNVKSTSGEKTDSIVEVTIEGDLP